MKFHSLVPFRIPPIRQAVGPQRHFACCLHVFFAADFAFTLAAGFFALAVAALFFFFFVFDSFLPPKAFSHPLAYFWFVPMRVIVTVIHLPIPKVYLESSAATRLSLVPRAAVSTCRRKPILTPQAPTRQHTRSHEDYMI